MKSRHKEYSYSHSHSRHRRRNPRKVALDLFLFTLVILVPLTGAVMLLAGIPVPALLIGAYSTVALTVAGVLFLVFTALGVGGFGKASYFFSRTHHGRRWVSTKEAKGNLYLIGTILLLIGILAGMLTIKHWTA